VTAGPQQGPLTGFTVLDFTTSLSGPLAAGILADLGADVIKVERPCAPDRARSVGTRVGDISAMFHMANRGKRSVSLDLRDPADLAVAHDLARDVDVVVENFRPGVTGRIGIDYDTLAALNPDLVYLSISGFGPTGPYSRRAAFDSLLQAYGGFAALQGNGSATKTPALVDQAVVDKITGMVGAQSVTAALLARERGAGGQRIDVTMFEVAAWFVYLDAAGSSTLIDAPKGDGDDATTGKRIVIRYSDGWGLLSFGHDDSFRDICAVFGVDLEQYPVLTRMSGRDANPDVLAVVLAQIEAAAATMTRAEGSARLAAADAMYGEVLTPGEIPANEQMAARGLFVESVHPTAGRILEPRFAATFSVTEPGNPRPSATLGQHDAEVRAKAKESSPG
jgi:crotonobetainyl-CoA:carnitine CoA-transferase CaiB-like acyl-CoA transferase